MPDPAQTLSGFSRVYGPFGMDCQAACQASRSSAVASAFARSRSDFPEDASWRQAYRAEAKAPSMSSLSVGPMNPWNPRADMKPSMSSLSTKRSYVAITCTHRWVFLEDLETIEGGRHFTALLCVLKFGPLLNQIYARLSHVTQILTTFVLVISDTLQLRSACRIGFPPAHNMTETSHP
jgi:hypothetical protein